MMKVILTTFKSTGKYNIVVEYKTNLKCLYDIWKEAEQKYKYHYEYFLIDVPEHLYNHPRLVIGK